MQAPFSSDKQADNMLTNYEMKKGGNLQFAVTGDVSCRIIC